MHPNLDPTNLTTTEIEQKIRKLEGMYFVTSNEDVRRQMILMLDTYKIALQERRIEDAKKRVKNNNDNGLDELIKIS
jgi:hypothetical protein|tara:strand:+ start:6676 stop:6906 length:231 start_codon:yes stop_codon:yes gene_type:complete